MPFLQYKCPNCNKRFEELVAKYDVQVACPDCATVAVRDYTGTIYSATGTQSKKCSGNCKTCGGCR